MVTRKNGLTGRRKWYGTCAVVASAAMVLAACGSSGGSAGSAPSPEPAAAGSSGSSSPSSSGSPQGSSVSSSGGSANSGSSSSIASGGQSSSGGSAAASGSSSGQCSGANKHLHVAFVSATTSQDPMQEMADGAKMAAKEDGNTTIDLKAPPDVNEQHELQMLQSETNIATDGIAWESVEPDIFVHALQQVKKAGIPLVAVDNNTPKGVTPDLLVSNSNHEVGVKLGQAFVKQVNKTGADKSGTVVLGNDIPTLGVLVNRMKGLEQVIKKQLPNMKIVGPFNAKGQGGVTKNHQAWASEINDHPKAVGFLGVGGPDGISLPLIKKKTGGKWLAGSGDIPEQALQGVKNGQLFALSSPEHFMKGYIAIHEIIKHDRTCQPIPSGWWNSGTLLITKKNIDQIIARQKSAESRYQWFKKNVIPQQLKNPPIEPISKAN